MIPQLTLDGLTSEGDNARIVRCHSRVRFTIYPHEDPVFNDRSTNLRQVVFSGESSDFFLRTFSWTKTLGPASGKWQAAIRSDPRVFNPMKGDLLPGDWVQIDMIRNGVSFPVCLGIVDTVNRNKRTAGGANVVHWQISGGDHGSVMDRPITYSNIFAYTLGETVRGLMYDRVKGTIGGSPGEMFKTLIEAAFTKGSISCVWKLPPSLAEVHGIRAGKAGILDLMTIETMETRGHYYNEAHLWAQAGQTLHQALEFWCSPLMHQMTYDVTPDLMRSTGPPIAASIKMRPYINLEDGTDGEWFKLPTWRIPSWLPTADDLARSDFERFNVIQLLSNVGWEASQAEQTVTAPPLYSQDSLSKYGLRPNTPNTHFLPSKAGLSDWIKYRIELQDMICSWYAPNPYLLSGRVNLPIPLPEARIGHRLQIDNGSEKDMITAFIEGVGLEYQASMSPDDPPRATSTLTLTRGYEGTDQDGLGLVQRSLSTYTALDEKKQPVAARARDADMPGSQYSTESSRPL